MKKVSILTMFLSMAILSAIAIPAKRGQWKNLTLANGSEVRAMLVGDEFGHFWRSENGKSYIQKGEFFEEVDGNAIVKKARVMREQTNARRSKRNLDLNPKQYYGQKKGLIILVNFSDVKFDEQHTNEMFQRIANEEGYSEGKFKGSITDYFKAQSNGQFELDFDVVGPVTVSKKASYYGENNTDGSDKYAAEMIIEAVNSAKLMVTDWYQYDWNNDGEVDQVYVIYAGNGEAEGGASNTIWPHAYDLYSANYYGDGSGPVTVDQNLKVNTYACGSELNGYNQICGIGTICHEFSHCLGLPDFYDINYSGGQGMGSWDLMDSGSYNGDGYQPAGYTSYERWMSGWLTPIELDSVDVKVTNMKSLQNGGESYIIYNKSNKNEFLMLENRQLEGWDSALPDSGLLIVHCDYNKDAWVNNIPNGDPSHQRMVVVPADGICQSYKYAGNTYYTEEGDVFPQGDINAYNKNFKTNDSRAKKAAQFFNGDPWITSSVDSITQNADKTISFNFVAVFNDDNGGNDKPGVEEALFYESFDKCQGTGGNDGLWSNTIASSELITDNEGWVISTNNGRGYGANQCARFGNSSAKGDVTTPAFNMTGEAKLTFRAGAWNSRDEGTQLTVSATGAEVSDTIVTMQQGAFKDFELTLTGEGAVTVTFQSQTGSKSRFFLDEVMVMPVATAIETVTTTRPTGRIYTLDGRFMGTDKGALKHGIYVIDGKKIIK